MTAEGPTLDYDLCFFSDEECSQAQKNCWGCLLPVHSGFKAYNLTEVETKFGRDDSCEYCFCDYETDSSLLLSYSKVHFIVLREQMSTGVHTILKDVSSNGTFINRCKVGRNKRQVLNHNDEISLSNHKNKGFIFLDHDVRKELTFPDEIERNYVVSKILGRGACGEVRLVFEKNDSCKSHAMKIIPKKKFSPSGSIVKDMSKQVLNEVNIMKNLKHPCIVNTKEVINSHESLFIILELVEGGELFDRVLRNKRLSEPISKVLFYQIVQAVKYLHSMNITHRDLKPENILLTNDDDETLIKVTDFGLSKLVHTATMMQTLCGTPTYLAPEVLSSAGKGSYTKAIDCWSLGVILFVCLGGYPPFSEDYPGNIPLERQIIEGRYSFPDYPWKEVSNNAIDLIKKLLTVDPSARLSIDDTLHHCWLTDDAIVKKARHLMYKKCNGMPSPEKVPEKRASNLDDNAEMLMDKKRMKQT
ncbi:CHEK2 (predicted) [Pycnogonum litorale]